MQQVCSCDLTDVLQSALQSEFVLSAAGNLAAFSALSLTGLKVCKAQYVGRRS